MWSRVGTGVRGRAPRPSSRAWTPGSPLKLLHPHLILHAFLSPDHSRLRPIHQHFRRPATRVAVRPQHRTIRADVQNAQQIALTDHRTFPFPREKVAGFAAKTYHV